MNKRKRIALVLTVILIFNILAISSGAATDSGVMPRWSHCSSVDKGFVVADGTAEAFISYAAFDSMSRVEMEVVIQKQAFWFIWNTLRTWTDTSTQDYGDYIINTPADGAGNYRAVFTLTFYGADGTTDVVEDTMEYKYNG